MPRKKLEGQHNQEAWNEDSKQKGLKG